MGTLRKVVLRQMRASLGVEQEAGQLWIPRRYGGHIKAGVYKGARLQYRGKVELDGGFRDAKGGEGRVRGGGGGGGLLRGFHDTRDTQALGGGSEDLGPGDRR